MITVYKYPLALDRRSTFEMPAHAELLDVQIQGSKLVAWARVQVPQTQKCKVELFVAMTGEDLEEMLAQCNASYIRAAELVYLTTVQDPEVGLVYHMFYTQTGPYN